MRTLQATFVRELHLADGFVAAASGVARAAGRLYVAVDDAFAVAAFPPAGDGPGELVELAADPLPDEPVARKAAKPDLEAIAALPSGDLVVLGSGSARRRHRGFVVSPAGDPVDEIDLRALHAEIAALLGAEANLEGATWHEGELVLAQRGSAGAVSALVRVAWPDLRILDVEHLPLGDLDGVPLGMTDVASAGRAGLLAAYAAEATANAYDDGPVAGSAIGFVGRRPWRLDGPWKVEGLCVSGDEVLMVTDADDPALPALLLRSDLPEG